MNWMCICGPHCGFRGAAPGGMLGVDAASRLRALRLCGTGTRRATVPHYLPSLAGKARCLTQLARPLRCMRD